MNELAKEAKDRLTLKPDPDESRYGCDFSLESINDAPEVELEEDDG